MRGAHLRLEGVAVRRGRRDLLRIERLDVGAGDFLAIVGRNGAGKTTLLNLCCGLLAPTSGRVLVDGFELRGMRRTRLCQQIGYLPQATDYNADLPLTVGEVVRIGRAARRGLLRRFTPDDDAIADQWIKRLGLADLRRRTFRTLSGGEQQKVLLARAMVQEPNLLLLDEPGAHLDIDWRRRLTDTVEDIYRETQITVIMVSHDVALIPVRCTQVALMERGRLVAGGPPEAMLTPATLSEMYGCPVDVWERHGVRYAATYRRANTPGGIGP